MINAADTPMTAAATASWTHLATKTLLLVTMRMVPCHLSPQVSGRSVGAVSTSIPTGCGNLNGAPDDRAIRPVHLRT